MSIDVSVRAWCGDRFAVLAVDGEVDADGGLVLAEAISRIARTQQAVIVDLTHVRLLAAAGLHCLNCVDQPTDGDQGALHLVCPESSIASTILRATRLHDRWPVHRDFAQAVDVVMSRSSVELAVGGPHVPT
ncbi:MAG TPA: STAS domain-containing protein [Pseudonocardia sp.]